MYSKEGKIAPTGQHKNPWTVVSEAADAASDRDQRTTPGRWLFGTRRATSTVTKKNTVRYHDTWNAQRAFSTSARAEPDDAHNQDR